MKFKSVGFIEMCGVFVSCISMYTIAYYGGGVWTLIGGHIVRLSTKLILIFTYAKWFPSFTCNFKEVKSYISFGILIAVGQSLYYVYDKSDKFWAGKMWNSSMLGYYSFALQLAKIPTEKIVVLLNQVSFSAFASLQNDKEKFNRFYLNLIRITATLTLPIFVGGFIVGEDLVKLLLNEKWYPIVTVFKYLCLSQIIVAIGAINNFVHIAQGRPQWGLVFNVAMMLVMPTSFYFAVQYGLEAILIPWFTSYLFICIIWIIITLKKIGIKFSDYIITLLKPTIASVFMVFTILAIENGLGLIPVEYIHMISKNIYEVIILAIKISVGGGIYGMFIYYFDRNIVKNIKSLRSKEY